LAAGLLSLPAAGRLALDPGAPASASVLGPVLWLIAALAALVLLAGTGVAVRRRRVPS
jgi:hypothetical protein